MADCLYGSELKELQNHVPSFHYIPTFSREEPGDYRTGYVHAVYEEICRNKALVSGDGISSITYPAQFYLCGWKNMVDEAKKRIQDLGYDRKAIHQELYG